MDNDFPAIEIAPEEEALFRIQRQVTGWVSYLLSQANKTQTWLANKMGKQQPYINRILSTGGSNMTLKTIAELEVALGRPILLTLPEFEFTAIYDDEYWSTLRTKRQQRRDELAQRDRQMSRANSNNNTFQPFPDNPAMKAALTNG
jgi:transcriptional regulator with XRE-family HTH domain